MQKTRWKTRRRRVEQFRAFLSTRHHTYYSPESTIEISTRAQKGDDNYVRKSNWIARDTCHEQPHTRRSSYIHCNPLLVHCRSDDVVDLLYRLRDCLCATADAITAVASEWAEVLEDFARVLGP